jgi:hypothetical protein
MKWTVVWVDNSEEELADIWLHAEDRQAITLASHRIERELRENADIKGEEFYGDRIYQHGPLALVYQVVPEDRLVRVTQVQRIKA